MKIIDAHFHMFPWDRDESTLDEGRYRAIGHRPGFAAMEEYYRQHDFVHGVIMSNGPREPENHIYPEGFHYCIGLDPSGEDVREMLKNSVSAVEENLKRERCCGIKLYPGYLPLSLSDPLYEPYYALAERYHKPVAVHMGQTAFPMASLKYSHPLTLDEVAERHPRVQFVMCHFGNPFLPDAAAVAEKNPNVAVDLSGLLEGMTDLDAYFEEQAGYVLMLKGWIAYVNDWSKFMFGTDFPAVNLQNYVDFCRRIIPEGHWREFFFDNANRIYGLGL